MKMDKVAGSGNDCYFTPSYAITPILKYLKKNSTIWCPFDTKDSLYVKILEENGHTVIHTHIDDGVDFFDCTPPHCDYIISNLPFSLKFEVFQRLFEIDIPFMMLVGVVGLFESQKRFNLFKNNDFEIQKNCLTYHTKLAYPFLLTANHLSPLIEQILNSYF